MPATTDEVFAGRDIIAYLEPFAAANSFPTNNAWGTAPGGAWFNIGWTKDGVAIRWRQQIQDYMVDQFLDPLTALPLSRDLRAIANIGQVDWPTLVAATSSGSASGIVPPGTGDADFFLDGTPLNLYYSTLFDIRNPITNQAARWVLWRARGVGDIELRVHLPDLAQLNVEMRAFPDFSASAVGRIAQFRMTFAG